MRDVADAVSSIGSAASSSSLRGAGGRNPHGVHTPGRRRRKRGYRTRASTTRSSRRVHAMTDADLEAELAQRRTMRQRERDRYARAMRAEKLTLLESELMRLRSEISRIDPRIPSASPPVGAGTPPHPRWESLGDGRGRPPSLNASAVPRRGPPGPPPPPGGPPPPPPMSGLRNPNEDEEEIDPERQKREKAERQRRREQKRKEREAKKKPMTIAEIIRSAGNNPMSRLKPKGSTETVDVNEAEAKIETELSMVSLKKVEKPAPSENKKAEETKDDGKKENEKKNSQSKDKVEVDEKAGENASEKGVEKVDEKKDTVADVNESKSGEETRIPENGKNKEEGINEEKKEEESSSDIKSNGDIQKETAMASDDSKEPETLSTEAVAYSKVPKANDKSEGATSLEADSAEKSQSQPSPASNAEPAPQAPPLLGPKNVTAKQEITNANDGASKKEGTDMLAALQAKLPSRKSSDESFDGSSQPKRRLSIAEKRKLRAQREKSFESGEVGNATPPM